MGGRCRSSRGLLEVNQKEKGEKEDHAEGDSDLSADMKKNHNHKNRGALKQIFSIKCILFWEEILRPLLAIVQGLS